MNNPGHTRIFDGDALVFFDAQGRARSFMAYAGRNLLD